ncbi:MAG: hypothetical protein ACD_51C00313G0008 [uncultured bacterium]|nr:MAG: hypothetical protein ACD_51C00313G0008 [uncultured bacterium]
MKFIMISCKAKPIPNPTAAISAVKSIPPTLRPAVTPIAKTPAKVALPTNISTSSCSSPIFSVILFTTSFLITFAK